MMFLCEVSLAAWIRRRIAQRNVLWGKETRFVIRHISAQRGFLLRRGLFTLSELWLIKIGQNAFFHVFRKDVLYWCWKFAWGRVLCFIHSRKRLLTHHWETGILNHLLKNKNDTFLLMRNFSITSQFKQGCPLYRSQIHTHTHAHSPESAL